MSSPRNWPSIGISTLLLYFCLNIFYLMCTRDDNRKSLLMCCYSAEMVVGANCGRIDSPRVRVDQVPLVLVFVI